MNPRDLLLQATKVALKRQDSKLGTRPGRQKYYLACLGIRHDGVKVYTHNTSYRGENPRSHAEIRVLRKIGSGTVIYIARVSADGVWKMARPCQHCQDSLRHKCVRRVYYTVRDGEYGVLLL